jgi:hypothetical protein
MEANQTDREWIKDCYVTTGINGARMRIDESIRAMVDNSHIRDRLREMAQRGVDLQRSITARPANIFKLAKWAAECVKNFNFAPAWLAIGDEPGAAVSRTELMDILHGMALEESVAAVERERIRVANSPQRFSTIG